MFREIDARAPERERAEPDRGGRGSGTTMTTDGSEAGRDALTHDLDLPRGSSREPVQAQGRAYRLSGHDVRTLAAAGAFRVVPAGELTPSHARTPTRASRDIERLQAAGLVKTTPYVVGRTRTQLVMLTDRGRDLLEAYRRPDQSQARQAFYAGDAKPRELAHDTRLHQAYLKAAERLSSRGVRVRRVVLEDELKRDYQRFLQAHNRGRSDSDGTPMRDAEAIAEWARAHQLPYDDGHLSLPDVRLECEDVDGRLVIDDVELVTPHYRGAHAAAKARSGFTRYRAAGARVGGSGGAGRGGRGRDARLAEELLP